MWRAPAARPPPRDRAAARAGWPDSRPTATSLLGATGSIKSSRRSTSTEWDGSKSGCSTGRRGASSVSAISMGPQPRTWARPAAGSTRPAVGQGLAAGLQASQGPHPEPGVRIYRFLRGGKALGPSENSQCPAARRDAAGRGLPVCDTERIENRRASARRTRPHRRHFPGRVPLDLRYSEADEKFRAELARLAGSTRPCPPTATPPPTHDWEARRAYDTSWQRKLFRRPATPASTGRRPTAAATRL